MKFRNGFVTNSSSSSFTCEVCGDTESGYDISYEDAGMIQCENCGAVFCEHHKIGKITRQHKINFIKAHSKPSHFIPFDKTNDEAIDNLLLELGLDLKNDEYKGEPYQNYDYPSIFCPFCNMQELYDKDIIHYLLKKSGKSLPMIEKEIKSKFLSYEDFRKEIE